MTREFTQRQTRQAFVKQAFSDKTVVKMIAGIANTNQAHVLALVEAANRAFSTTSFSTAIDIAAEPSLVSAVREATELPVFVSCIQPARLARAAELGADVVELGNYDALYAEGLFLSHDEVLALSKETIALIQGRALVCVTIPGHLSVDTQRRLAVELEALGVDFIQTEGAARTVAAQPQIQELSGDEKVQITLSNTEKLVKATRLPVMTASGITPETISLAFAAGASAVGVGHFVNQHQSVDAMTGAMMQVLQAVPLKSEVKSAATLAS